MGGVSAHAIVTSYNLVELYRHPTRQVYSIQNISPDTQIQVKTPKYTSRHPKDESSHTQTKSPDTQNTSPDIRNHQSLVLRTNNQETESLVEKEFLISRGDGGMYQHQTLPSLSSEHLIAIWQIL